MQTQQIEIQLERLQAKVNTNLKEAYQAGFSVVTTKSVRESNRSNHSLPKLSKLEEAELGQEIALIRQSSKD